MAKLKVVITDGDFPHVDAEREELAKIDAELQRHQCRTPEEVLEAAKDADALLVCFAKVTRQVIESLPKLKMIARYGIGVDMIDVMAAAERGIPVTNVPDYCWDEVADHAFALLLTCARKILVLDAAVRKGKFDPIAAARPIHLLRWQTLGIVGLGHIGRGVALRAQPFGFKVLAADPFISDQQAAEVGAKLVELEELLQASDFVTLHVPLNEQTRHLINEKRLRLMKRSAFLINTCRGGVVDNAALAKALQEGWIAGAGLDVFEQEPLPPDSPFLKLENVILTPHAAWYSEESMAQLQRKAAQEIVRFFKGEPLRYRVN